MRHGEVDPQLGWWMLEDPHMWHVAWGVGTDRDRVSVHGWHGRLWGGGLNG